MLRCFHKLKENLAETIRPKTCMCIFLAICALALVSYFLLTEHLSKSQETGGSYVLKSLNNLKIATQFNTFEARLQEELIDTEDNTEDSDWESELDNNDSGVLKELAKDNNQTVQPGGKNKKKKKSRTPKTKESQNNTLTDYGYTRSKDQQSILNADKGPSPRNISQTEKHNEDATGKLYPSKAHYVQDTAFVYFQLHYNKPFYVYEVIDWMSTLCNGKPVTEHLDSSWMKHSDDYWFYKNALEHPLRTTRPEKASLFVVGGLLNLIVEQRAGSRVRCCVGSVCNMDLVSKVERMLLNSTWFQRSNGSDHIVVASHYASQGAFERKFPAITSCNWISYHSHFTKNDRMRLYKTYVGRRCPPQNKTYDIAFIASMHPERATFKPRRDACKWLLHQNSSHNFSVAHCGSGEQCPALAKARMGLHIRGDTLNSNRLMDILLSETVPVFTDVKAYDLCNSFLPWRNMSVLAPVDTKEHFFEGLKDANVSRVEEVAEFNKKYNMSSLVDWRNNYLFEQYMALFMKGILQ